MKDLVAPSLTGVMALLGVALGAVLSHYLLRTLTVEETLSGYRYETYRDFIHGQSVGYADDPEKLDTKDEKLLYTYRRIAVFSSSAAVSDVAAFMRASGGARGSCSDEPTGLRMYRALRNEVHRGSEQVADKDLAVLLFRCEL